MSEYEPKKHVLKPREEHNIEQKTTSSRRGGSLFRVDFSKIVEEREYFTFSKFINRFVE